MKIIFNTKLYKNLIFGMLVLALPFLLVLINNTNAQTSPTPSPTAQFTIQENNSITTTVSPSPESTVTATPTPEAKDIKTQDYSGDITKIEGRTLTINTEAGVKQVNVSSNVQIKKNSLDSNFEELKVNDRVTYKVSDAGEVLSLSAASAELFDFGKYTIPAAVLLVLALFFLYKFLKGRRKGAIRTSTERVE